MLQNLEKQGMIWREKSEKDAREKHLCLTEAGEKLNVSLEEKANQRILGQIHGISDGEFLVLLDAMEKIERIMGKPVEETK